AGDPWTTSGLDSDVPYARAYHSAIWTGSEMIVFGGQSSSVAGMTFGSRYDPATDTWTPIRRAPDAFAGSAVWTGTRMFVWPGIHIGGALYDPTSDTWTAASTVNEPEPRQATMVWTGQL